MDASVCHWNVRVILFLVLLLLLSPFILCTPKVQDIDYSQNDKQELLNLIDTSENLIKKVTK